MHRFGRFSNVVMRLAAARGMACLSAVASFVPLGCTCASEQLHQAADSAPPPRAAGQQHGARCAVGVAQQTLRAAGGVSAAEDGKDLFAVELGSALVHETGFWIPWMSGDGSTSRANLTYMSGDLTQARTTELGSVSWDAAPPRAVLLAANELLVAVPDADASGDSYRIAHVAEDQVTWAAEVDGSSDDSVSFDLASTAQAALLVWDDYDRQQGLGTIRGIMLEQTGNLRQDLGRLSPSDSDAETPRLAAYKGGYWLAWLSVALQGEPNSEPASEHLEPMAMRTSQRWIEVMPLDSRGRPTGDAVTVSSPGRMVQGFDMQAGHDGSLLLSWREDFSNAGTSGGEVFIARLTAGGALERHPVQGKIGGTLPTLLFDPHPPSGVPHAWLTLEAEGGDSLLAALSPLGPALETLAGDSGLGVASALGALGGQLLLAKPKGRDVAFALATCAYVPDQRWSDAGL